MMLVLISPEHCRCSPRVRPAPLLSKLEWEASRARRRVRVCSSAAVPVQSQLRAFFGCCKVPSFLRLLGALDWRREERERAALANRECWKLGEHAFWRGVGARNGGPELKRGARVRGGGEIASSGFAGPARRGRPRLTKVGYSLSSLSPSSLLFLVRPRQHLDYIKMTNAYDAEKANKKYDDDTVAYTEEASVVGIAERKLGVSLCGCSRKLRQGRRQAGRRACNGLTLLGDCSGSKRRRCC